MGRYVETVSNEGIIGNILTGAGALVMSGIRAVSRSIAVSRIIFDGDMRPEVNGKSSRSFDFFIRDLKAVVASGEQYDVCVFFLDEVQANGTDTSEHHGMFYFIGTGKEATLRVPTCYQKNEVLGIAQFIAQEVGIKL